MRGCGLCILALGLLLTPLWAGEPPDAAPITVPTGWTRQQAELEASWADLSTAERSAASTTLESRYEAVLPQLPADQYSAEEGIYVGYRINVNTARVAFANDANARTYGAYAYALLQAETYAAYCARQATLPKNPPDVPDAGAWENRQGKDEQGRQGDGWLYCAVDYELVDHSNPVVAGFKDTMFVSCMDDGDTLRLWRSVDNGRTWGAWHRRTDAASRMVFDLAIEPESHSLYIPYRFDNNDIWVQRMTDFADSTVWSIGEVEGGSDICNQPHVSVEHEYADHRICCAYYNETTDQVIIARSTDNGSSWSTVYTSTWTNAAFPKIKSCQGAASSTTDRFYFIVQTGTNSLMVLESTSGEAGSFIETEYTHGYPIDAIDIAATHNSSHLSTLVTFSYQWLTTDYNVRTMYRNGLAGNFVSALVDGDSRMCMTPVVSVDYEWEPNHTETDYYHLSYYKDHNSDAYYIPMGLRCLNDSTAAIGWSKTVPAYFESNGLYPIDTLVSDLDYGQPAEYYQIDMTTTYDPQNGLFVPAIAWMREYSGADRDPRVAIPDPDYVGVEEGGPVSSATLRLTMTPNPASGRVALSCRIDRAGAVDVCVYDLAGRLVHAATDQVKSAGQYDRELDAGSLAAGVYFVKVTTPDGVGTSPLVIVK